MYVSHFQRARGVAVSIERLFDSIRSALPADVTPSVHRAPFAGTNPVRLAQNCLWARRRQRQVNHVTGDIHYLAIVLASRRTVLTIHDCVALHRLTGWRWWIVYLLWYWLPTWRAGTITTISEKTKGELLSYLPVSPDRVQVIPNCVWRRFPAPL